MFLATLILRYLNHAGQLVTHNFIRCLLELAQSRYRKIPLSHWLNSFCSNDLGISETPSYPSGS